MSTIRGNMARNELNGTNRADRLFGLGGDDEIDGNRGDDRLYGNRGNDEIDGDAGRDRLWGGGGNDELDGGSGNDTLLGGAGRDRLEGGHGNDRLTGGGGADVFEFERGDGRDRITDFTDGLDRIELDDFGRAQVQRVIDTARQDGDDLVLTLSSDTSVRLQDFDRADLGLSDFVF